jgi:hypothetical protein
VELKKQIAELRRQLAAKSPTPAKAPAPPSREQLQAAEARGHSNGFREARNAAKIILKDVARGVTQAIRQPLIDGENELNCLEPENGARPENPERRVEERRPPAPTLPRSHRQIDGRAPAKTNGTSAPLPKGEAATLAACIQFPDGLRREQLTVLTGYKRSSRDAYVQRLRERGYVESVGDVIRATAAGEAALPNAERLPTGEALQEYWRQRLPEGERRVLDVLIEAHPSALARAALDDLTGYQRSSRDAYLQRLRAKQLIEEPSRGEVRASQELFL